MSITKITHPKTSGVFPRKRLFQVLDECRESPVIWVTAPAGSGKTTLVASYLSDRKLHSIWYRMDQGDTDIATFFYYMGLVAEKAAPSTLKPLTLFTKEYLYGISTFTLRYFEDLYSRLKPPYVIVLDNYHHVQNSPQINEVITTGLDILPDGITVILVSREAPPPQFARLRGGDSIRFLGAEDLFFTVDESGMMLRQRGFEDISDTLLTRLHDRTQGWAAGLVLFMDHARRKGFDDRLFSGFAPDEISDYFSVEVYDKADAATREFLLKTAFVPGVTVSMAERLTGLARSQEILGRLHGDNFFTEKTTEPDPVYRYHPLFRDFLQAKAKRLHSRDDIARTQRAAAALLRDADRMEDAAALLVDAGDWDDFIPFLVDTAPTLMAQGRIKTLGKWLASIPGELAENSPWLLYWRGQCTFHVTPAEGRNQLEQAFILFEEGGDDAGALLAWAGIADTFIYDFDHFKPLDRWIDWLDERITRNTLFPTPEIESAVASSMVGALVWRRPDHAAMRQWITRALSSSLESRNSSVRLLALRRALLQYVWVGDQGACHAVLDEMARIVKSQSAPPVNLIAARMITAHYYAWLGDESERALQLVEEGLAMADETGIHVVDSFLAVQGAFAALNKGDEGEVTRYAQKLEATLQTGRRYVVFYNYILALQFMLVGKYSEALAHAMQMKSLSEESGHPFPEAWASTLISQAAYELGDISLAEKELATTENSQVWSPHFEFIATLIRAYFLFGLGKEGPGAKLLARAMKQGRRHSYSCTPLLNRPAVWSLLCAKALAAGIEIEYIRELIRKRKLTPPVPASEFEHWPWPVKIHTLGRFALHKDDKRLEFSGKAPRRIISLLKVLLACGSGGAGEEKLIAILWPDSDGAAACDSLSVSIHRLRQLMGDEKALRLRDGNLTLNPGICWVDAFSFEELLARADKSEPEEAARLTEQALRLYQGPFLEDIDEPWAISRRERLRAKYLRAIRRLGERLEITADFGMAANLYEKGLETDPLAEELYRHLMLCRHAAGQKSEAVAAYERCRKMLGSVLRIAPSPETEALYRVIISSQPKTPDN